MSPFFLPRIVPLPPFDAASAATASTSRPGGGCCFDAVADAEEALEAQVTERERDDTMFFPPHRNGDEFFFAPPSRALSETVCFSCFLSR